MINAILSGLLTFIYNVGNVFTAPVNAIISTAFPDLSNFLSVITNVLNMISSVIAWFLNLIPPITRALILLILNFWVLVTPIRVAVWNIAFGLDFIKRINIFGGK